MAARKPPAGRKPAAKRKAPAKKPAAPNGLWLGAGIGSAAIAAALLYVTRAKKQPVEPK